MDLLPTQPAFKPGRTPGTHPVRTFAWGSLKFHLVQVIAHLEVRGSSRVSACEFARLRLVGRAARTAEAKQGDQGRVDAPHRLQRGLCAVGAGALADVVRHGLQHLAHALDVLRSVVAAALEVQPQAQLVAPAHHPDQRAAQIREQPRSEGRPHPRPALHHPVLDAGVLECVPQRGEPRVVALLFFACLAQDIGTLGLQVPQQAQGVGFQRQDRSLRRRFGFRLDSADAPGDRRR